MTQLKNKNSFSPRATVVLTPGRSGSSLLTEILGFLGVGLSQELTEARPENARGFFEDSRIVAVHKKLFLALGASNSLPLPNRWLETAAAQNAARQLEDLVSQEMGSQKHWGFKDPRTTVLLPMWEQVFNRVGVVPRYVFAFRHPGAVAASLRNLENRHERRSEEMWLFRASEALHHSSATGYFIHYEDWFKHPRDTVLGLAAWCGLEPPQEDVLERKVAEIITPDLNHSGLQEQVIRTRAAARLYSVLKDCSGEQVDNQKVLAEVAKSRRHTKRLKVVVKLARFLWK